MPATTTLQSAPESSNARYSSAVQAPQPLTYIASSFSLTGVVSPVRSESPHFPLTRRIKAWRQVPILRMAKAFWMKWPWEKEATVLLGCTVLFLVSSLVHLQFSLIPQQSQYLHCREQIDTLFRKLSGRRVWVPSGKSNNWARFPTTWGSALITRLLFKRPPPPTLLPCFRRRERSSVFGRKGVTGSYVLVKIPQYPQHFLIASWLPDPDVPRSSHIPVKCLGPIQRCLLTLGQPHKSSAIQHSVLQHQSPTLDQAWGCYQR